MSIPKLSAFIIAFAIGAQFHAVRAQQAVVDLPCAEAPISTCLSQKQSESMLGLEAYEDLARRGKQLYRTEEFAAAQPIFAELLELQQRYLGDDTLATADLMNFYGLLLEKLDRLDEASATFAAALELPQNTSGVVSAGKLKARFNLGRVSSEQGKFSTAVGHLETSLAEHKDALGDTALETQIVRHRYASILRDAGRPNEAYQEIELAIFERRKQLGPSHPATLDSLRVLGGVLYDLRDYERAAEVQYALIEAHSASSGEGSERTLTSKNNYAITIQELGEHARAVEIYRDVWNQRVETFGKDNSATLISAHNYAAVLMESGRWDEAKAIASEVLDLQLARRGAAHPQTLYVQQLLADIYKGQGNLAEAKTLLEEVIKARSSILGADHHLTKLSRYRLAQTLMLMPSTSNEAIEIFAELIEQTDDASSNGDTPFRDGQPILNAKRYFEGFADAGWSYRRRFSQAEWDSSDEVLEAKRDIFAVLQFSQINPASQALARSAGLRYADSNQVSALVEEREKLVSAIERDRLSISSALMDTTAENQDNIAGWRQDLAMSRERLVDVDFDIEAKAPDYFDLIAPDAISLDEARAVMQPDEAALLIVPTDLGTHLLLVSDTDIQWHRSDWTRGQINAAVQRLLFDVGANVDVGFAKSAQWEKEGEGAYPYSFETAQALYNQIIAPITGGLEQKSHLFVSASGALSSLPLGILVKEVPTGPNGNPQTLRAAKWFADDIAILQIPNIQSLQFLRTFRDMKTPEQAQPFLGFGDPVLEGRSLDRGGRERSKVVTDAPGYGRIFGTARSANGEALVDVDQIRKMARLPGTADELNAMWAFFKSPKDALFLANQATETSVRQSNLNANVIAFATHGLLAGEISGVGEPGLIFTPPTAANDNDDGYLSSSEIAALDINADWVILSACNTAAGDGSAGAPGLSGLSRSFFYAGATSLLASHWPVRDDVAAKLTVRTIELADNAGLSRAQAFQQAMRELRNDSSADSDNDTWAHPNAWAPFALVGDR